MTAKNSTAIPLADFADPAETATRVEEMLKRSRVNKVLRVIYPSGETLAWTADEDGESATTSTGTAVIAGLANGAYAEIVGQGPGYFLVSRVRSWGEVRALDGEMLTYRRRHPMWGKWAGLLLPFFCAWILFNAYTEHASLLVVAMFTALLIAVLWSTGAMWLSLPPYDLPALPAVPPQHGGAPGKIAEQQPHGFVEGEGTI